MKTIFRFTVLGIFAAVFSVAAATSSYAQDDCANVEANQALYKKYTDNYASKQLDQVKVAIAAAKEYIEKYGACVDKDSKPLYADQVNYLKGALPERIAYVDKTEKLAAQKTRYAKFNTAAQTKNVADIYTSGKDILTVEPDFLDVVITLANAGFDQAVANPPIDTYNNDVITYSKSAIQKIEAGKPSETYGVFSYSLKSDKFKDSKSNALGALNYNVGYVLYYRQGKDSPDKKKEALGYFYKSTQYDSFTKKEPLVYQSIGAWYLDQAIKIDKDRQDKIKAAGGKDTDETLALFADQKGYADRAIDAYARAYKLAKEDKDTKPAYTTDLYSRLKELYAFRYDGKIEGIDAFVSTVMNKSLPDPSTPITPVKEEAPATPSTTTAPTNTTPTPTPKATTKPPTTPAKPSTPAKPTASTDSGAKDATTTTAAKTNAKKSAPKKKGTR